MRRTVQSLPDAVACVRYQSEIGLAEHTKARHHRKLRPLRVYNASLALLRGIDRRRSAGQEGVHILTARSHAPYLGGRLRPLAAVPVVSAALAAHRHGLHVNAETAYGFQILDRKDIVRLLEKLCRIPCLCLHRALPGGGV